MGKSADSGTALSGEQSVIRGIFAEAGEEAAAIREDGAKQAEKLRLDAESQAARLLQQADTRARELRASIMAAEASAVDAELRRYALQEQDTVYEQVFDLLRQRLAAMSGEGAGYRELLISWVVEAAVGLGTDEALVYGAGRDGALIDAELCREAAEQVKRMTGRTVRLSAPGDDKPGGQGVFLRDAGGRLAFDNRVEARIRRSRRELVRMIAAELSAAKKEHNE